MPVDSVTSGSATPPADMIGSRSETMGQADFLQMLTAQLKAQDPMNPLQGQEFASQLAQFSSLQELQKMGQTADQTLQANILLAQTFNNTMASSLIGKTVRADLDQVALGASGSAGLSYTLPSPATEIKIEIKDSDGKTVRTLNVNPQAAGDHTVEWDGVDSNGHRVSAGNYTYTISAKGADGADVKASTFVEGRVSSVRYENGNAVLTVGGMTVMLGQVISISESGSDNASKRG